MSVERVTVEYPGDDSGTGVSGPVTTGSVSDDPLEPGGGGNTLDDTMAALNPTVDYDASEASGNYLNLGSAGTMTLQADPLFGNSLVWRQAPGVARGLPVTYGFMCASGQANCIFDFPGSNPANLPASTGWTTGTFNCFVQRFHQFKGDDWLVFAPQYRSGGTQLQSSGRAGLGIDENGSLKFLLGAPFDGALGNFQARYETADSAVPDGEPVMITAVQRGDGNGVRLYVNAVEQSVTPTLGAGTTLDDFINEIADGGRTNPAQMSINGWCSGTTASYFHADQGSGIIQRPAMWRNVALSDAQITELFNSVNLNATPSDYYEFLLQNYVRSRDAAYCQLGWLNGVETTDIGELNFSNLNRMNWNATRQQTNTLETQRTTRYPNYKSRFQNPFVGGQYIASVQSARLANDTVGTWSILVTHNTGVPIGQTYPIMSYGEGISGNDDNCTVFFAGNSFGTSVVFVIGRFNQSGTITGDFYRETISAADANLTPTDLPKFTMITVVQDGVSGVQIYIDANQPSTAVSSGGATFDANSWFAALAPLTSNAMAVGYSGSTAHVGDLDVHHMIYLEDRALSAQDVSDLWDAVNGVF